MDNKEEITPMSVRPEFAEACSYLYKLEQEIYGSFGIDLTKFLGTNRTYSETRSGLTNSEYYVKLKEALERINKATSEHI